MTATTAPINGLAAKKARVTALLEGGASLDEIAAAHPGLSEAVTAMRVAQQTQAAPHGAGSLPIERELLDASAI